jgi:glycosyltransferase involved in cell wall biosynthesis
MSPKVSCVCPTFARTHLLAEAIESFIRQDYLGETELIVLNDFYRQNIIFNHQKVKIVNHAERYATLGEKRHAAYKLATGDILVTWGDDDIHLPNRVTRIIKHLADDDMCFEGWYYALMHDGLFLERRSTAGAMAVRSESYHRWGGIPPIDVGEDVAFNALAKKANPSKTIRSCQDTPAFLYRWHGTKRRHVSGTGSANPYRFMLECAEKSVEEGEEPSGDVYITPVWREDYVEKVKHAKLR